MMVMSHAVNKHRQPESSLIKRGVKYSALP